MKLYWSHPHGLKLISLEKYRFRLLAHHYFYFFVLNSKCTRDTGDTIGKKEVPFSMAILGNEELMHEWFPKHLHMRTARMK